MSASALAFPSLGLAAYILLRYVVANPTEVPGPAVLLNKLVAMLAMGLLSLTLVHGRPAFRRWAGRLGVEFLAAHLLLTLALLSPAAYPRYFNATGPTRLFEASLLAAIGATLLLVRLGRTPRGAWGPRQERILRAAQGLGAGHLLALGWPTWMHPEAWPWGLPPLTLLAFLGVGGALLAQALQPRDIGAKGRGPAWPPRNHRWPESKWAPSSFPRPRLRTAVPRPPWRSP